MGRLVQQCPNSRNGRWAGRGGTHNGLSLRLEPGFAAAVRLRSRNPAVSRDGNGLIRGERVYWPHLYCPTAYRSAIPSIVSHGKPKATFVAWPQRALYSVPVCIFSQNAELYVSRAVHGRLCAGKRWLPIHRRREKGGLWPPFVSVPPAFAQAPLFFTSAINSSP